MRSLVILLLPIVLTACAQQGQNRVDEREAVRGQSGSDSAPVTGASGLLPRRSGLDSVSAVFAFDLSAASVYLDPLQIDYRKLPAGPSRLRAKDYQLNDRDRQRLQALMAESVAEQFLAPRGSRLVDSPSAADYRLVLQLQDLALAAPLEPTSWTWRVYTEQAAFARLAGNLYDRDGQLVMQFSDRRDIGDQSSAGRRLQRFNNVTFWGDMRMDLLRAFSSLDRALR